MDASPLDVASIPLGTVLSLADRSKPPQQRLHLIVLGVSDIARSAAFYTALGWQKSPTGHDGFVKFDLGGYALCLLPIKDLAADLGVEPIVPGYRGLFFVHLVRSVEEVTQILARAVEAGGRLVKPATRTPWGVAGFFADPDGHIIEVDYEKAWVFDGEGALVVDKLNS